MKIRLLNDYRGHLTGETFYRAGVLEIDADSPEDYAQALIHAGRAVEVEAVRAAAVAESAPPRGTTRRRGGGL